jgi:hypothetical protein
MERLNSMKPQPIDKTDAVMQYLDALSNEFSNHNNTNFSFLSTPLSTTTTTTASVAPPTSSYLSSTSNNNGTNPNNNRYYHHHLHQQESTSTVNHFNPYQRLVDNNNVTRNNHLHHTSSSFVQQQLPTPNIPLHTTTTPNNEDETSDASVVNRSVDTDMKLHQILLKNQYKVEEREKNNLLKEQFQKEQDLKFLKYQESIIGSSNLHTTNSYEPSYLTQPRIINNLNGTEKVVENTALFSPPFRFNRIVDDSNATQKHNLDRYTSDRIGSFESPVLSDYTQYIPQYSQTSSHITSDVTPTLVNSQNYQSESNMNSVSSEYETVAADESLQSAHSFFTSPVMKDKVKAVLNNDDNTIAMTLALQELSDDQKSSIFTLLSSAASSDIQFSQMNGEIVVTYKVKTVKKTGDTPIRVNSKTEHRDRSSVPSAPIQSTEDDDFQSIENITRNNTIPPSERTQYSEHITNLRFFPDETTASQFPVMSAPRLPEQQNTYNNTRSEYVH